jgi:hypothetical protein
MRARECGNSKPCKTIACRARQDLERSLILPRDYLDYLPR